MLKTLLTKAATSTINWVIAAGQIIGYLLFSRPSKYKLQFCLALGLTFLITCQAFAQLPVSTSRPRIFLDAATKTAMLAKKNSNDANWVAVLADANKYLPKQVIAWNPESASSSEYYGTGDIFYSYCGSSWEEAAITLGMAHQLTKTNNAGANATAYSNKLMALADVMIKGYADYPANTNYQPNMFQFNSSYATRHVGKAMAIIYDWCYNELGATRKAAMLHVMKDWYTFMSTHPYMLNQLQDDPTGNYFVGHLICAAYMGYAIGSDDPLSQKMIEFARQRVLGTPGSLANDSPTSAEKAHAYFTQSVKGGLPSGASRSYLGPTTYLGAPQQDGIPVQGWSYGGETGNFIIDYIFLVKSATGESMIQTAPAFKQYFTKNAEALIHSYTPNRFQYDNSNDNGSFLGCTSSYGLPLRLSALLEGTPEGGNIEYFYRNVLQPPNLLSLNKGYQALSWEKLLYDKPRTATAYNFKPYYPIPQVNVYNSVQQNSSLNKFYIRSNWSASATWAAVEMGTATYDQHNHNNAGHFKIIRGDSHDGDDHLLVAANEVAKAGGNGIDGPTNYSFSSSLSNTLFINDFNDYDADYPDYPNTMGGQTSAGYDEPTHQEQNDKFSYFRSDLTSAYYMSYYSPDTSKRTVRYYYRSILYLRNSNIFVSYDKFQAKNSTNAKGQYKKHLRWHFLNQPVISGNNITATNDNSKLFIHTVLPAATTIVKVNESNNPDNTFGSNYNYIFNTNTWRAEVGAANNPLKQDIVTVLQPGSATTATEMVTTAMATSQNNMEGSLITVNGNTEVVLFNTSTAKYPVPVSTATYAYTGPLAGTHTLCGLDPDKKYAVTYNGATVTVTKSASGLETASPSGVLSFTLQTQAVPAGASLTKLVPNTGSLSPVFNKDVQSYSITVPNAITTITFAPTASDAAATITVKGVAVANGAASAPVSLAVGANTIPVKVSLGGVDKVYTVTVTRALSASTYLPSIKISPSSVALTKTGNSPKTYTAAIEYGITSIKVLPAANDVNAVIKVEGQITDSGTLSQSIAMAPGVNTIHILVTAQDGVTTETYTLTVTRALHSTSTYLPSIKLSPSSATVTKTSNSPKTYKAAIDYSTTSVKVLPTASDAKAVIRVEGQITASGTLSQAIAMAPGENTIHILVTADDGITTEMYTLTVTRPLLSNSTYLPSIKLSPSSATVTKTSNSPKTYKVAIEYSTTSVKVLPTASDVHAVIRVEGNITATGTLSQAIAMVPGENIIHILVTAEDGVTTEMYTLTVTRPLLSNSTYLPSIKLSPGSAAVTKTNNSPKTYTAEVSAATASVKVLPTANDIHATIKVEGQAVTSGTLSQVIPVGTGANVIHILVTAEDGIATEMYTLTVTKAAPPMLAATNASNSRVDVVQKPEAEPDYSPEELIVKPAVSPNGDGINDRFIIEGITAYSQNTVSIMNRNGGLVYEAKGYDNSNRVFEGRATNGSLIQPGTYFYAIEYVKSGELKRKTGYIVVKY